jgi:general stress protein 26
MYETGAELAHLQAMIDRSMQSASEQLRSIARPDRRLSAAQLADALRGKAQMAVATVTARGEPRVSPLDVLLIHGRFFFCTSARAAKVRHLRHRPAVSIAYIDSDLVGITAHGQATLHEWGSPRFAELDREFLAVYGGTPSTPDEAVVFIEVEPALLYTFDRRAEGAAGND